MKYLAVVGYFFCVKQTHALSLQPTGRKKDSDIAESFSSQITVRLLL